MLIVATRAGAQLVQQQEEAPESVFQAAIGDKEVELLLSGAWTASLSAALGILIPPSGVPVFPSTVPGLEPGQLFRQVPDLTFSVWLMRRYFVEASVQGDFLAQGYDYLSQNTLRLGYRGQPGDFLERLTVANKGIGIAPFALLSVPEQGNASVGVEAGLNTGAAAHSVLLRYDNNTPDSLVFLGHNLVEEHTVSLDSFIRGRFFKLPDQGVTSVELYLQDVDGAFTGGDGRRYRLAGAEDALVDTAAGVVRLAQSASGRVLVYYRKGAVPVGDATLGSGALPGTAAGSLIDLSAPAEKFDFQPATTYLGQLMSRRAVTVNGHTALRLWEPGEFSPFEILSSYALEDPVPAELSRLRVRVVMRGSTTQKVDTPLRFRLTPGADHFTVYLQEPLSATFGNLYPFLDAQGAGLFDPDNRLYGPQADPGGGYLRQELLVSRLTPVGEYSLGTGLVPGSVRVLRNGLPETRFTVDYDTGLLTFQTAIDAADRLEVHFRRVESQAGGGDLLFAWGSSIPLGESLTAEIGAGLRWNALPGTYSREPYSRTGSLLASASLSGEAGPLKYRAAAGAAFTNPDTSGVLRLLGMEGGEALVPLSEELAYPSAPPEVDTTAYSGMTAGNRGRLLYKDYRSYGIAGTSTLMPYDWPDIPPDQVWAYQTGGKIGPYQVAGSSGGSTAGRSLVLDFDLAAGEWVGTQIPLYTDQGVTDLSALEALALSYRAVDVSGGSFDILLEIGETSEDLDGDGTLDQEYSEASSGFAFNDAANSAVLPVGGGPLNQGNGRRDSEDVDGNGFLDTTPGVEPVSDAVATAVAADTSWKVFVHRFTPSEREALRRTRTVRVLVRSAGSAVQGRVLLDRLSLQGSRFAVTRASGGLQVSPRETLEAELSSPPSVALEQAFPEVARIFHPLDESQQALEVSWSGGPGDFTVRGYTDGESGTIDYRTVLLYYRVPSLPGGATSLDFSLRDTDGRGLSWSVPAQVQTAWAKMEVDLDGARVLVNGTEAAGASVSEDREHGSLKVFEVGLTGAGPTAGSYGLLDVDEVHLREPRSALGAAAEADLELNLPGTLLEVGGHPLLRDVTLRQTLAAETAGFSTLYSTPAGAAKLDSRTEAAASVSVVDVAADLTVQAAAGRISLSGGHSLQVPNMPFPVAFTDSFSRRESAAGVSLSRRNILDLRLAGLAAEARTDALASEGLLSQDWRFELKVTPGPVALGQTLSLATLHEGFLPAADYLSGWLEGYTLVLPWEGGAEQERRESLEGDWSVGTSPVGVRLQWALGAQSLDIASDFRRQRHQASAELTLPVALGPQGQFTLLPGYHREITALSREASAGDLASDLDAWALRLGAQGYLLRSLPLAELFGPSLLAEFGLDSSGLEEVKYASGPSLRLTRPFSSRLGDLFLPSRVEVGVERTLLRQADLIGMSNRYTLETQTAAVNLFGAFGAYPLFPFYRSDEFSSVLGLTVQTVWPAGVEELDSVEVNLQHYLSFQGDQEDSFTVENRLSWEWPADWSETLALTLLWYRHPRAPLKLPLVSATVSQGGYWAHQEGGQLTVSGTAQAKDYHPMNLVLRHRSSLVLPKRGQLTAEVALGGDLERDEVGGLYWRAGVKGSLELRLEY